MENLILWWAFFGICGTVIGWGRRAALGGFLCGILLGPLGCLIAIRLDHRHQCPLCGGRLEIKRPVWCPHCRMNLALWRAKNE